MPSLLRGPAGALLIAVATSLISVAPAAEAPPAYAASANAAAFDGLASTELAVLRAYMYRSSPSDPRYYANGNWHAIGGPPCWYCYDSAAVGAATLSAQPGAGPNLRHVAIDTFNRAIAEHQLPNGAFFGPNGTGGIATGFFSVDLGISYLELRGTLDANTRGRWSAAIRKAADYLINSGDATWYINGNVNLRQTEVFWLAWSITKARRFLSAYNAEWAFTISPSHLRWPAYGLHFSKVPVRSDGRDGAGYLAESQAGARPGFDPSYTDAQLDTATDLYVLTRDAKYIRLMNLLFNELSPLISASWTLNATHGSRKSYMTAFMNPAVSVLAASGDRPGLAASVGSQLNRIESEYRRAEGYTNVNFFKGVEGWLSMPLLNRQWPNGMAPDTQLRSQRHKSRRRLRSVAIVHASIAASTTPTN